MPDEQNEYPWDPASVHRAEQAGAALREMASSLAQFYNEMIENDVPPAQAAYLTGEIGKATLLRVQQDAEE